MNCLVQKYGGTSVGSVEKIGLVAKRIQGIVSTKKTKIAVVVSAMSGETNRLVSLMESTNPKADPKFVDMATAAGEQVSCALLSAALQKLGIHAQPFLAFQLGIKTDLSHQRARIQSIDSQAIYKAWETVDVAVVAGFQGITSNGQLTTLGRGGSDTSAVALAVALEAEHCEINTDVDGFYSTDPRLSQKATLIDLMDYESCLELASLGSKVLHTRCVEIAAKYKLPIIVRNSFKGEENKGTKIMALNEKQYIESPVVSGVTVVNHIAKVTLAELPLTQNIFALVFSELASFGINVDVIVHDFNTEKKSQQIGFTVEESSIDAVNTAMKAFCDKNSLQVTPHIESGFSKVSVVGLGMRSHHGVAAKTFSTLSAAKIQIHMISTSEIKISCLVQKSSSKDSVRLLHEAFCEDEPTPSSPLSVEVNQ